MDLTSWLTLCGVCLLGAMSPGPSLALVLKHTLIGGRIQGQLTGIAHATAIGLYALLSLLSLSALINALPELLLDIQLLSAAYLLWLGINSYRLANTSQTNSTIPSSSNALRDGFLMAFLNPKAAVFFFAIFSQLVTPATPLSVKIGYALTALVIDMAWYCLMAWLASRQSIHSHIMHYQQWIERVFGLLLSSIGLLMLLFILL